MHVFIYLFIEFLLKFASRMDVREPHSEAER